ncbi:class I SAM-dependent methyltransferase [Streptomyces lunaelactis]|uniref:TylF/MycF/NovP-related O-methyltransferase n=1 Tax=Streptomyces lunaelactis TaxID=1535768 RepID=UPI00158534ED|nr:TylF/MycF/NovP-related O-methyltransferase [Streptomyces lunaelactis]NUK32264.1 class I SAM-dependent methyltransferase [Streptomyces lunaelactis]NUK41246.1 class I SAM-dependent methyltransferase [Streptomyces lunaelactis]
MPGHATTAVLHELSDWLLEHHSDTVDADRLPAIRTEIERLVVDEIPGAVVELGCFKGAMALWMRALLDATGQQQRPIHVYDSFQGLPERGEKDPELFPSGFLRAEPEEILALHDRWGCTPPTIHPGWFADTLPNRLPAEIAFAYLDGDYYDSIRTCLDACVPRLAPGGALIVDDYADLQANPKAWAGLPGVKAACEDFFGTQSPLEVLFGDGDLAFGRYVIPSGR